VTIFKVINKKPNGILRKPGTAMVLKIAVIICTKNRANDLDITLESIFHQTLLPDSLLIVDDSSNDVTEKIMKKYLLLLQTDLVYLHPKSPNSGLPAARNFGIASVPGSTDIIIFLDDDVTLDPRYLESIREPFLLSPKISGAGGYITTGYHTRPWYEKLFLAPIGFFIPTLVPVSLFHFRITKTGEALAPLFMQCTKKIGNVEWLSGCNMAYRISVFREGNIFDENFVRYAQGEDILFSHRLHKNGKKLLITKESRLHHRVSPEERMPSLVQLIMVFGYRKYAIQKFSGKGAAGSLYYWWFVVNFFMSAFILSLIQKNGLSYMKNTLMAYRIFKQFEKQIGMNDLKSFNAIFSNPRSE
jgi:glycosyltransferase involved in cell wall biosynthesis